MTETADTFERSCDHWSDAARAEMEAFYELARVDYRYLAEAYGWADAFRTLGAEQRDLHLADIACGSGKFPEALLTHAGLSRLNAATVHYDLLDPSDFSVREAKQVLQPPFTAGREFVCTLQDWAFEAGRYDLAWATHALYCVPAEELAVGLERMLNCLRPEGVGFVAQGRRDGHYVAFYDYFRAALRDGEGTPYSDGTQVAAALDRLGAATRCRQLDYVTIVPATRRELLESYLQRCAFDDTVSLDEMLAAEPLAGYLAACFQPETDAYHFTQRVEMIQFAHAAGALILEDRSVITS